MIKIASRWTVVAASLVTVSMTPALCRAATPEALATAAGCSACHAVDRKLLGPSYHDIAGKYKGNSKAPTLLAAKVRSGGSGAWGSVPMPAQDARKISDADLATVIGWILKQ